MIDHYKLLDQTPGLCCAPTQSNSANSHTNLVVDEDNMKLIENIEGNIAVVGVVGPFHSGKSFLLNQLMSKPAGFQVGPTVAAETMGLWVWGKPLKAVDEVTGEPLSILFLGEFLSVLFFLLTFHRHGRLLCKQYIRNL